MRKKILGLVLAFMVTAVAVPASANEVFDNGVGGAAFIDEAFRSDSDPGDFLMADDFVLATSETITTVEWSGLYAFNNSAPAVDDFIINIYGDGGGIPIGGPLATFNVGDAVNRELSGSQIFGFDIYEYSADINFAATAGTTYWLNIDGHTIFDPDDDWHWGVIQFAGNSYGSIDQGASWATWGNQHDFRLISKVPEPSAALLLGLVSAVAFVRRKK